MIPTTAGEIKISRLVNPKDPDYNNLYQIAEFFSKDGATVELTPRMSRPKEFKYDCIYGDLRGTKYEGKCPDMRINGVWYEYEGFNSNKPKNAFRNMMNHGLMQSSRLIIDRPNLTERYILRSIKSRLTNGTDIKELWLREKDGEITLLYKNTDG